MIGVFIVFPKGFEPPSSEPESDILSIELRKHILYVQKYKTNSDNNNCLFEKKKAFLYS